MPKKKKEKTAPASAPSEADVVVKKKGKPGRPKKAAEEKPEKKQPGKVKKVEAKLVTPEKRDIQTAYNQAKQAFRTAWNTGVQAAQELQKQAELMVDQLIKLDKAKTLRQAIEIIRSENEDLPGFSRASLYKSLPDNLKQQEKAHLGPRKVESEQPKGEIITPQDNGEKVARAAAEAAKELDEDRSPKNITEEVLQARINQEVETKTRQLKTVLVSKDNELAKAKHEAEEAIRNSNEATKKAQELEKKLKAVGETKQAEKKIVKEEKEVIQIEVEMIVDDGKGGKINIYKQMLDFMMKKVPKFYLDANAKTGRVFKAYT